MSNFTDIKIFPRTNAKFASLRGNGSCVIKGCVRVNFTLLEGPKGLFAVLPERSYKDGAETKRVKEVSLPDENLYAEFQKEVRTAYQSALTVGDQAKSGEEPQAPPADDGIPF